MEDTQVAFNFFYLILLFCLIYPPSEFQSAGVTIENLFSNYLGSESLVFVQYHINRSCFLLASHSIIPLAYFVIYAFYFGTSGFAGYSTLVIFWNILLVLAIFLPIFVGCLIFYYKQNNWENHPISRILKKYANSSQRWQSVAEDINTEYRRNNKLVKKMSSISNIIATENWIIKTSLYFVHFAHQSDTALIAVKSDNHDISIIDSSESVQFVNIQVKPTRTKVRDFTIRINSLDFKDLQDRIARPITVLSSVKFNASITDQFVEVFVQEVIKNSMYEMVVENVVDTCFACMIKQPDVKINKNCTDNIQIDNDSMCANCYCKPMWCVSCLAKWFASRQNQYEKETWLRNKATCPMCRAKFCVLDVSLIRRIEVQ